MSAVEEYTKNIVELCSEQGVDLEAEDLIKQFWGAPESKRVPASKPSSPPVKDSSKSKATNPEEGCPYKFEKGKREGERCGVKPKSGGIYCSTHQNAKNKEPKEKKIVPQPKKPELVLTTDRKSGKLIHPDSGLVFKSKEKMIVIGRLVAGKVVPVDEDTIELAKKYRVPFEQAPPPEKEEGEEPEDEEPPKEEVKPKKGRTKVKEPDSEQEEADPPKEEPKQKPKKGKAKVEEPPKEEVKPKKKVKKPEPDSEQEDEEEQPKKTKATNKAKKSEDSLDEVIKDLDDKKVVSKALGIDDEEVLTDDD